jgi:hypothetical protein
LLASTGGPFVPAAPEAVPAGRPSLVPSPPDRPFELGRYPASAIAGNPYPARVANVPPAEPRAGFAEATPAQRLPLVPAGGQLPALVTGRGLY